MTTWLIRKPEATDVRGLCVKCNKNLQKPRVGGTYRALCGPCDKKRFNGKNYDKRKYVKHKLKICERCLFKALDPCQLDVHHKDGNHCNNDPNNLETLCANCHRLEHFGKDKDPLRCKNPKGSFSLYERVSYWVRLYHLRRKITLYNWFEVE